MIIFIFHSHLKVVYTIFLNCIERKKENNVHKKDTQNGPLKYLIGFMGTLYSFLTE